MWEFYPAIKKYTSGEITRLEFMILWEKIQEETA